MTNEQSLAADDLATRLRAKADMIELGEKIAWGSDSAIMREAEAEITALRRTRDDLYVANNANLDRARSAEAFGAKGVKAVESMITMTEEKTADIGELVKRIEYVVGNPSAWEAYDEGKSEMLREAARALIALEARCAELENVVQEDGEDMADLMTKLEVALRDRIEREPVVKALEWRKTTDHPQDYEDAVAVAAGIGGMYSITEESDHFLLWDAGDNFTWTQYPSIPTAKAAAQADYELRILSALETKTPEEYPRALGSSENTVQPQRALARADRHKDHTSKDVAHQSPERVEAEPDFARSIASVIKEESESGAAAGWCSCTGCHETNEGYETGHYPYSTMFGCFVGSGCTECGGIGVTWEYWSESDLAAMLSDDTPATDAAPEIDIDATADKIARHLAAECKSFGPTGRLHGPTYEAAKEGARLGLEAALASREAT